MLLFPIPSFCPFWDEVALGSEIFPLIFIFFFFFSVLPLFGYFILCIPLFFVYFTSFFRIPSPFLVFHSFSFFLLLIFHSSFECFTPFLSMSPIFLNFILPLLGYFTPLLGISPLFWDISPFFGYSALFWGISLLFWVFHTMFWHSTRF